MMTKVSRRHDHCVRVSAPFVLIRPELSDVCGGCQTETDLCPAFKKINQFDFSLIFFFFFSLLDDSFVIESSKNGSQRGGGGGGGDAAAGGLNAPI